VAISFNQLSSAHLNKQSTCTVKYKRCTIGCSRDQVQKH